MNSYRLLESSTVLKILMAKDFCYLRTKIPPTGEHSHIAPQISLASPGHQVRSSELEGQALFIPSSAPHAIKTESTLHTFLIDPVHFASRIPQGESVTFSPAKKLLQELQQCPFKASSESLLQGILDQLLHQILGSESPCRVIDQRIQDAIEHIENLAQKKISAKEISQRLALSESRFLHLFKQETQLTFRRYVLWKKTMMAARHVVEGATVTRAAHEAGFTDSAHFSRVFKDSFGVTLSSTFGKREPLAELVLGQTFC